MKNRMSVVRILAAVLVLPLMGGCAGMLPGEDTVVPRMTNKDFYNSKDEAQKEYLKLVEESEEVLRPKKETEFKAGWPVYYGDSATGFTKQWDKDNNFVYIYPGHSQGMWGIDSKAMITGVANKEGKVLYWQDANGRVYPITADAKLATQEGMMRALLKGVPAAIANGTGAALLNNLLRCDDCAGGDTFNVQGGQGGTAASGSNASSGSASALEFLLQGCKDCDKLGW